MSHTDSTATDPHAGASVWTAGADLDQAPGAVVLMHGRGATARDILSLVPALDRPRLAYLAPQAADRTWYPNRFLAPLASNEPWLSSALGVIASLLDQIDAAGIPPAQTALIGFSQGACLALEFAARNARRYGGVIGLSGGLIGPPGATRHDHGNLDGTPVFLGCSDIDGHIPKEVVLESAEILRNLGGAVTARLYPGMGHTINDDEIAMVRGMLARFESPSAANGR